MSFERGGVGLWTSWDGLSWGGLRGTSWDATRGSGEEFGVQVRVVRAAGSVIGVAGVAGVAGFSWTDGTGCFSATFRRVELVRRRVSRGKVEVEKVGCWC